MTALPDSTTILDRMICAVEIVRKRLRRASAALQSAEVSYAVVCDLGAIRVINLEALVRIKLTAFRDKERTHLHDLIDVGLADESWFKRLSPVMAEGLQALLDTPRVT